MIQFGPVFHVAPAALAPARQAVLGDDLAAVGACPPIPHCPSLPSSESAYEAISGGGLAAWARVGRDMLLRGALVWVGIAAFDALTGREDPHRLARAVAGAAGIEAFVLGWTWVKAPRTPKV